MDVLVHTPLQQTDQIAPVVLTAQPAAVEAQAQSVELSLPAQQPFELLGAELGTSKVPVDVRSEFVRHGKSFAS